MGSGSGTLYSNDLLAKVEYPDKMFGTASDLPGNDQVYTYDNLGEETGFTDQNGTTHSYTYDVLARLTSDSIAVAMGNTFNIDTTVQSVTDSYDTAGRPYQQTSWSGAGGSGTMINQVVDSYNGFGQLSESQHDNSYAQTTYSGSVYTVNAIGNVTYNYTETNNGTENDSRLRSITYPDGTIEDQTYAPMSGSAAQQGPISLLSYSTSTHLVTATARPRPRASRRARRS